MTRKATPYHSIDATLHDQSFVPRLEKPDLWAWCCQRHRQFWAKHAKEGEIRKPPKNYHDKDLGKVGWFFPTKWVREFSILPQPLPSSRPGKPRMTPEERDAYVARVLARIPVASEPISAREAERWQLPAGSQVTPTGVTYPDGSHESLDALRLRHGPYRATSLPLAEQQNLEDMLLLAKRQAQADA